MKFLHFALITIIFGISCATSSDVTAEPPADQPEPLTITFLAVGQADATLIQKGDLDILVDTSRGYNDTIEDAMSQVSGPLEYLIITHPHYDHYGGAAGILKRHKVRRVITNGESRTLVTWERFEEALEDAGLTAQSWDASETLQLTDHLGLQVLAGGGNFPNTSSTKINDDSLVFMLHYQGRRILFTGDLEEAGGQRMVEKYCDDPTFCPALRSDVMKIPHHGSANFDKDFFRAINPFYGVVSAGYNVTYGNHCLPRLDIVETLGDLDVVLRSTNQSEGGQNIILTIQPGGTMVWSPEETQVFVWQTQRGEDGFECEPQICETGREYTCRPYN